MCVKSSWWYTTQCHSSSELKTWYVSAILWPFGANHQLTIKISFFLLTIWDIHPMIYICFAKNYRLFVSEEHVIPMSLELVLNTFLNQWTKTPPIWTLMWTDFNSKLSWIKIWNNHVEIDVRSVQVTKSVLCLPLNMNSLLCCHRVRWGPEGRASPRIRVHRSRTDARFRLGLQPEYCLCSKSRHWCARWY